MTCRITIEFNHRGQREYIAKDYAIVSNHITMDVDEDTIIVPFYNVLDIKIEYIEEEEL